MFNLVKLYRMWERDRSRLKRCAVSSCRVLSEATTCDESIFNRAIEQAIAKLLSATKLTFISLMFEQSKCVSVKTQIVLHCPVYPLWPLMSKKKVEEEL